MTISLGVVVGAGIGWIIGQLLMLFFGDEISAFIDRLVEMVRKACGLS